MDRNSPEYLSEMYAGWEKTRKRTERLTDVMLVACGVVIGVLLSAVLL